MKFRYTRILKACGVCPGVCVCLCVLLGGGGGFFCLRQFSSGGGGGGRFVWLGQVALKVHGGG